MMTSLVQQLQKDYATLKLCYFQSKDDRVKMTGGTCKVVDLSKPPKGVLIVDNFLSDEEVAAAEAQLEQHRNDRSFKERFLIATKQKSHAEQQFIIDMPETVAVRLRSELETFLGVEPSSSVAPKEEKLPARIIIGPTEEHIDEPKGKTPHSYDKLEHNTSKEAYRDGYIAICYLGGDGALVLGGQDDPDRIQVPVKPGRLVAWPNTSFLHSAHGETRRLIGPLAVIPGDRSAPLWLTVKGVGAIKVLLPLFTLWVSWQCAMLYFGYRGLNTDISIWTALHCSESGVPVSQYLILSQYLIFTPIWNAIMVTFILVTNSKSKFNNVFYAVNIASATAVIHSAFTAEVPCTNSFANVSAILMLVPNGPLFYYNVVRDKVMNNIWPKPAGAGEGKWTKEPDGDYGNWVFVERSSTTEHSEYYKNIHINK